MANNFNTQTKPAKKNIHIVAKIILLLIVLIIATGAMLYFRVPQKIGLIKSPAERLFTVTPDSEKAGAIMADLEAAGFNTTGVEVYVLPVAGTDDNVAIFVLDASHGFDFSQSSSGDPFNDFISVISRYQEQGINRAAVAYYNEEGKQLLAVTLPTAAAAAYAQGQLTDEQLMEQVNVGTDDLPAFIGEIQKRL